MPCAASSVLPCVFDPSPDNVDAEQHQVGQALPSADEDVVHEPAMRAGCHLEARRGPETVEFGSDPLARDQAAHHVGRPMANAAVDHADVRTVRRAQGVSRQQFRPTAGMDGLPVDAAGQDRRRESRPMPRRPGSGSHGAARRRSRPARRACPPPRAPRTRLQPVPHVVSFHANSLPFHLRHSHNLLAAMTML